MPIIRLPDGSERSFENSVTVADVAASIGAGLARAALAGKVNGNLVDTSYLIEQNADLAIVTERDAEGVDIIRHSTAHLLAYAVKELFPDAQVTIGPVIDNGFYYDFSYKRAFTPEDLIAIEKKMAELAKKMSKLLVRYCLVTRLWLISNPLMSITKQKLLSPFLPTKMFHSIQKVALPIFAVAHTCLQQAS